MSRKNSLSFTALALVVAAPLGWFACGGSTPPPESPADESASSSSSPSESAGSETPSGASSAAGGAESSGGATASDTASAAPAAAPAAPAAPPFGDSDCGKCVDKTCAAPAAACGKTSDCQATIDSIHSCGSDKGAAACVDGATPPTAAKPKKLATAYEGCAKKAIAKACKAKCK